LEHVLADAKSDGRLTAQEDKTLSDLILLLKPEPKFRAYIENEIGKLRDMTNIMEGRLPSLSISKVSLRAGELVHFMAPARYERTRHLASGTRVDQADGEVLFTDNRLLFDSNIAAFSVGYGAIVDLESDNRSIEIRCSGKGNGRYKLGDQTKMGAAILHVAVRKANQTIVERREGLHSRHIPRDIRQRVWQKYGGQCAECGAGDYLEYDHVVPVAKGGSNSENNVQLLCRRCNLKKLDNI
jgi:hypothetical protein